MATSSIERLVGIGGYHKDVTKCYCSCSNLHIPFKQLLLLLLAEATLTGPVKDNLLNLEVLQLSSFFISCFFFKCNKLHSVIEAEFDDRICLH